MNLRTIPFSREKAELVFMLFESEVIPVFYTQNFQRYLFICNRFDRSFTESGSYRVARLNHGKIPTASNAKPSQSSTQKSSPILFGW